MKANQYFKLFACCIPVKGAAKSIICDLQRNSYCDIPNSLYVILTEFQDLTLGELTDQLKDEETLKEYFEFLISNEFGFMTTQPDRFPELDRQWHHPSLISNAIVDTDPKSRHDYKKIFNDLDLTGCSDLQLRFFDGVFLPDSLDRILSYTADSRIASIEIILAHHDSYTDAAIRKICEDHQRVSMITFYKAPHNLKRSVYAGSPTQKFAEILYVEQIISSHTHCGIIDPYFFTLNTKSFMESIHHNSCLNRKVGIDVKGFIKNCPSLEQSFGHISKTSVLEAIMLKGFDKLWHIGKDQIKVCQDCEFRHICTDCRAYVADPDDMHSKPAKCGYDPYTAIWKEPSMQGMLIKSEEIS